MCFGTYPRRVHLHTKFEQNLFFSPKMVMRFLQRQPLKTVHLRLLYLHLLFQKPFLLYELLNTREIHYI